MAEQAHVAHGTPITWKSKLGYTYEGTITAGPDDTGHYTVVTGTGSTARLERDEFALVGVAAAEPAEELTDEQRASLRTERSQQVAQRTVTDAIMQVYTALREDLERETGTRVEQDIADELRIEAAVRVHNVAVELRTKLTAQIADKRALPPRESVPEPAATAPAVPDGA